MQRNNQVLVDNENETLVNLPSGKIHKNGKRSPIKAQKNVTCILFSMRRIGFFNDPEIKSSNLYKAFSHIKNLMKNFNGNFSALLDALKEVCNQLGVNANKVISTAKSYSEKDKESM